MAIVVLFAPARWLAARFRPRWLLVGASLLFVALYAGLLKPGRSDSTIRAYDAGPVFQDVTPELVHQFAVKNATGRTLRILETVCSCTCSSSALAKAVLQPGEETELSIKVHPAGVYRRMSIQCRLVTDSSTLRDLVYTLTFTSYPRIRFGSDTVDLGKRRFGGSRDQVPLAAEVTVEIYGPSRSGADSLVGIEAPEPLKAGAKPEPVVDYLEGGTVRRARYKVVVALQARVQGPSGVQARTITARTAKGDATSIPVSWSFISPIVVSPSRVHFSRSSNPDRPPHAKVFLRSTDGRGFRVLSVEGGEDVDATITELGGGSSGSSIAHSVELVFRADPSKRRFASGRAAIKTDHPDVPNVQVEWTALMN